MPYKSEAQRKFMWAKHPEIAKKWAAKGHDYVLGHEKKKTKRREPSK